MKPSLKQPGLVVSAAVHGAILLATLLVFSDANKFEDAQEAVAVEVVSDAQMNEIMKGDKTVKEIKPEAKPKVDKLAETEVQKPTPPTPDAKRDIPTPPPALKRLPDPGQDNTPEVKPVPTPPVKPPEIKPEPPKPEPPKPEPVVPEPPKPPTRPVPEKVTPPDPVPPAPDAEVVRPTPPKRQDIAKLIDQTAPEPPTPPKPKVRPHSKPDVPTPPAPAKPKFDEVAKLDQKKLDELAKAASQTPSKPKSGDEKAPPSHTFNPADINRLLSKEAAQSQGSTGKQLNATPTAGTQSASAAKMSPNLKAQLDGWMIDRYHSCWELPITLPTGAKYVPKVQVNLNPDGSLASTPQLLNPPSDPADKSLADSAVRAVMSCNPLNMPPHFLPYYAEWKSRAVVFDPEDR